MSVIWVAPIFMFNLVYLPAAPVVMVPEEKLLSIFTGEPALTVVRPRPDTSTPSPLVKRISLPFCTLTVTLEAASLL